MKTEILNQPKTGQTIQSCSEDTTQFADPETVLVVDDDPLIRGLEAQLLCDNGYQVWQAENAEQALRLAHATDSIDILVTDFVMPGLNGLELSQEFRRDHPQTPVLIVSGLSSALRERVRGMSRFDLLEKPFPLSELVEKVRGLLNPASPLSRN